VASSVRLGVVQPRTWYGPEEQRNIEEAVRYIAAAGNAGVDLLLFPENYSGPYTHGTRFDAPTPLLEAAARHKIGIAAGTSVETAPGSLYEGGDLRDFTYEEADELRVFDIGWGTVGAIVCSEVFVREPARVLALRGA
jgi:predicted amidohydrolase